MLLNNPHFTRSSSTGLLGIVPVHTCPGTDMLVPISGASARQRATIYAKPLAYPMSVILSAMACMRQSKAGAALPLLFLSGCLARPVPPPLCVFSGGVFFGG